MIGEFERRLIPKKRPPDHLLLTSGTVLIGIRLRSDSTTVTLVSIRVNDGHDPVNAVTIRWIE
jgi:hypothetical protein